MVRRSGPKWRGLNWVQKVLGLGAAAMGPKLMNRCKPERLDRKEYGQMLKTNLNHRRAERRIPAECERMEN